MYLVLFVVEYGSDDGSEEESHEEEEVIGPDGQKIMRKKKRSEF